MTHTHAAYNVGRKVRDYMDYNRIFVALSADAAGYEFKGRKPAGRCVLETLRDTYKISVSVQDLRPLVRYGLYLIFAASPRYLGVQVGTLTVDDKGKAEMRREATQAQLQGYTIKDVVAVAIITTKGNHLESPLSGYPGDTVVWRKTFFDITSQPKPRPPEAEIKKNPEPIPAPAAEPPCPITPPEIKAQTEPEVPLINEATSETPLQPEPEPVIESPPEPTPQTTIALPPEPLPELAEPVESDEEPIEPTEPIVETPIPTPTPHADIIAELPEIEFIPPPPPRKTTPYITKDTFAALRNMTPFALGDDEGVSWARFTTDDCLPAPHDNVGFFDTQFIVESYECYTHFILGAVTDREVTGYVLGVPGVYDGEAAVRAKELGLTEFRCYDPIPPTPGEFGYWLMGIV